LLGVDSGSSLGALLESHATPRFVTLAPAPLEGDATKRGGVVVSGKAAAGSAGVAGCATRSSELTSGATGAGAADGGVAPFGAVAAGAAGMDRF
jgi:hypothetical protein